MPTTPVRELLHFASPFAVQVEGEGTGKAIERLVLKGFASVATDERAGDRTDHLEFNIDEFMAAPTLLLNHRFWHDPMGNDVAIGKPLTMHAAKLVKIDGNDDDWGIVDLRSKEQINTFPKSKVPSLKKGSRGLFVTAEVTQDEVRAQIARGELGGMSWRGLVVVDYELDPTTNKTVRVLRDIDLFEISVTHIPEHNQSTFIVGKMVEGKFEESNEVNPSDVQLWQVRLEKSKFASLEMVAEYLKAHKLAFDAIREDVDSYFATQQPADGFQLEKTVRIKMGDVYMLMAPPKTLPEPTIGTGRLVTELVDVAKGIPIEGEIQMAEETKGQTGATDAGTVKEEAEKAAKAKAFAKAEEEEKAKKAKAAETAAAKDDTEKSVAEKQLETLGTAVAVSVANSLKPALEGIVGGMSSMGDGLKTLTETVAKMATGVLAGSDEETKKTDTDTEKNEVTKSADSEALAGILDQLSDLATKQSENDAAIVEVAKSAVALSKSIPNAGIERDEKIDTKKSVEETDGDDNSCFDSAFPWLSDE